MAVQLVPAEQNLNVHQQDKFYDAECEWLIEAKFQYMHPGRPFAELYLLTRAVHEDKEGGSQDEESPYGVVFASPWPTSKHLWQRSPVHGGWSITRSPGQREFYLHVLFGHNGEQNNSVHTFHLNEHVVWRGLGKQERSMESKWTRFKSTIWNIEHKKIHELQPHLEP